MTEEEKGQMSVVIKDRFPQLMPAYEQLTAAYRLAFTTIEGDLEFQ